MRVYATIHALPAGELMSPCWAQRVPLVLTELLMVSLSPPLQQWPLRLALQQPQLSVVASRLRREALLVRVYATTHALPAGPLMSLCWAQQSPSAAACSRLSTQRTLLILSLSLICFAFAMVQVFIVLRLLGRLPPRGWLCPNFLLMPAALLVKRWPVLQKSTKSLLVALALFGIQLVSPRTALTPRTSRPGIQPIVHSDIILM